MSGGIGAYLFQRFVLLLVNVFTICLGKGFALAKVHLYDISNDILSKRFWLSVYARGQKKSVSNSIRFLLSFTAQGQSKLKKQALQQPQLGAGRLLETNAKKSGGDSNVSKPCKNANPGF
jgi:hypothetical protein